MCGRYTLATPDPAAVRARFPIGESVEVRQRFNVAPGDEVLAVTTDRDGQARGDLLQWGLVPSWSKTRETGLKMINARVETVAERPAFSRALERFRCLVIADGFYEWQRSADGRKQGFHITHENKHPFAFAGLWSIWHGEDGSRLRTCTILTTSADPVIASLHDRMPIILPREVENQWLAPGARRDELVALLRGLPSEPKLLRPVGPAVNDARYDGPECLAAPALPQPTLF